MSEPQETKSISTEQEESSQPQSQHDFSKIQKQQKYLNRRAFILKSDMDWNPLLNYPRNNPCPCKSGKKFKKCHLNLLPVAVPAKEAKLFREIMAKQQEIVFTMKEREAEKTQEEQFAEAPPVEAAP